VSFRKPLGDVLGIHPCIRRSLLALQDTIATRLGNERRTSHPRVEVVVEEMVEARVHDCSTSTVALKRNRDIEMLSRRQTRSGRDDPRMLFFGRRDGDRSFMGMCWKQLDMSRRIQGIPHDRMQWWDHVHSLEVTVAARVIIRPGNARGFNVVCDTPFGIRFGVPGVEVIRGTDAAERAKGNPQVLMVARSNDGAATLTESADRRAIPRAKAPSDVYTEEPKLIEVGLVEL